MKQKKARKLGVPNRNLVAKHQFQRGGRHRDDKVDYNRKEKHKGRRSVDIDLLPYVVARVKRAAHNFFHPRDWKNE